MVTKYCSLIRRTLRQFAGRDVSHNASDEIDVDDDFAKRFIERNIAGSILSKPAKETAEKKARCKRKALKEPYGRSTRWEVHPQGPVI